MWGRDVKSWSEIVSYYRATGERILADFVEHVWRSKRADLFHPRVGLGNTYLYRSSNYEFSEGVVLISRPYDRQMIRLWYGTEPDLDAGVWSEYSAADAIAGFERLAHEHGW